MLTQDDVGHRVVVRRSAGSLDGRPQYRDLLGDLLSLDGQSLTVRTTSGLVTVPMTEVHRAKRVPPRPARRPG